MKRTTLNILSIICISLLFSPVYAQSLRTNREIKYGSFIEEYGLKIAINQSSQEFIDKLKDEVDDTKNIQSARVEEREVAKTTTTNIDSKTNDSNFLIGLLVGSNIAAIAVIIAYLFYKNKNKI